jgi:SRSO17 transposase
MENGQIVEVLADASHHDYAFIDREPNLPEPWTQDVQRRHEAHVREAVSFRTKPQIGQVLHKRALEAAVPFVWVTVHCVYGGTWRLRHAIAEAGRGDVLAVLRAQCWG